MATRKRTIFVIEKKSRKGNWNPITTYAGHANMEEHLKAAKEKAK